MKNLVVVDIKPPGVLTKHCVIYLVGGHSLSEWGISVLKGGIDGSCRFISKVT